MPEKFRAAYPGFQGDIRNVARAIEHIKRTYLARLNPNRPQEAWVEAMTLYAMDGQCVRELFQRIGLRVLRKFRSAEQSL
jgi:hypothetical protein